MSIDEQIKRARNAAVTIQRAKFGYESLVKAEEVGSQEMKDLAMEILAELPEAADELLSALNGEAA